MENLFTELCGKLNIINDQTSNNDKNNEEWKK